MSVQISTSSLSSYHLWLLVVLALLHLCLSDPKSGDVLCMDGERQALAQFKHGLMDESDRLASWVGEKSDCCRWAGIVCDNITGHVREIRLRGPDDYSDTYYRDSKQRLGGHLSPSLLELKQLKHLDLSSNDFKDIQIPSFIGSLTNLRYLNLFGSNFGGMIPLQIGNLSELRVLSLGNLYGTRMMVMKMQWLSSLRWLRHLDISGIDLSKAIDWFQVINALPSLVELHLSHCELSDIHPQVPSLNLTSLSMLDISENYFHYNISIPRWIFSLTGPVSLDLSYCLFDNTLPSDHIYSFRNLTSLESLITRRNDFRNSSSALEGLSNNLKSLDISGCGVSSLVFDSIHNLTSLVSLDLSENQLTKAISNSFGNLCNLRDIRLSGNNFGNISLTDLLRRFLDCNSPSLESLYVSSSDLSGPIPYPIRRLTSLKVLDLSHNQLSGNLHVSLGQLSMLKELRFSHNFLTGIVTETHFAKLVSLKLLDASGNNLTLRLQAVHWIPPFQMHHLLLSSWCLGPRFPLWLQSQRELKKIGD